MEKNYYFVGIKGTGMAALARVLHDRGCHVEGSDIEKETFTQAPLEQAGIQIHDFDPANIKPGMTIVQGNAFSDDQPEIVRAKELGDKVQSYPATVEELVEQHWRCRSPWQDQYDGAAFPCLKLSCANDLPDRRR